MKFLYAIENMVESLWDIVFILFSYFDDIIKVFYTFCCFFCCNFCICISFVYFQPCSYYGTNLTVSIMCRSSSDNLKFLPNDRTDEPISLILTSIHKFGSQTLPGLRLAILQSILLVDIAGWYIGSIFLRH